MPQANHQGTELYVHVLKKIVSFVVKNMAADQVRKPRTMK